MFCMEVSSCPVSSLLVASIWISRWPCASRFDTFTHSVMGLLMMRDIKMPSPRPEQNGSQNSYDQDVAVL